MPKTRGSALGEGVLYRDGDLSIAPLPGGTTLYVWWYDASYGGGDRRRASLGTDHIKVAVERLNAFKESGFDGAVLKAIRRGIVPTGVDRDPFLADLMADFLGSPEHKGAWTGVARMLLPTIEAVCSETRISQVTPRVQKAIIAHAYARGYAVATVLRFMGFVTRVVSWGAEGDDDECVRCLSKPRIINSPFKVCQVLDVPEPEKRNWHPDLDGMAQVLALLADEEPMRRWALTMLTFACRVEAALEAGAAELHGELFHLNPSGRRQRVKKWRPSLPVPWSSLAEFRSWGDGPWIDRLTVSMTGNRIRAVGDLLGMPKLVPTSLRDFASSALRHADIDYRVRTVDKEHRRMWMGHRRTTDISDGYGRFRPDFLINPRVATEAFLRDLDRRSGGALFRQGPDKRSLRELYPPRMDELDEIANRQRWSMTYGSGILISDNDDRPDPDPESSRIWSDLPGATRGTLVVLGAWRDLEGGSDPISGPFRQIADKIEGVEDGPIEGVLQAVLGILTGAGIQIYERETSGDRELFLVAPAEALVPVSRVPDLLRLVRPRVLSAKRLPGRPKIGRLKRLRPPKDKAAPDTPPARHKNGMPK